MDNKLVNHNYYKRIENLINTFEILDNQHFDDFRLSDKVMVLPYGFESIQTQMSDDFLKDLFLVSPEKFLSYSPRAYAFRADDGHCPIFETTQYIAMTRKNLWELSNRDYHIDFDILVWCMTNFLKECQIIKDL